MDGTFTVIASDTEDGAVVETTYEGVEYRATINSGLAVITVPESALISQTSVSASILLTAENGTDTQGVVFDVDGPIAYSVLDVPAALASFTIREAVIDSAGDIVSEGAVVTSFQPNTIYSVTLDLADTDGVYVSDSNPAIIPMSVDVGSEYFDSNSGITNKYVYTSPSFVSAATTATFTFARYTNDTNTDTVDFTRSVSLSQSTVTSSGTLPDLGSLKGAPFVEGYGSDTVGGRGQAVQVASNASEFEAFWTGSAAGRILFDFAGDVEPVGKIVQGGPNKTVYGQTARGEGVQVFKPTGEDKTSMQVNYSETILQHLRLRAGTETSDDSFVRALDINRGDRSINNFLSYHNDYSWGTDQAISVWYDTQNVGFWGDMFAEPLNHNGHGFNYLVGNQCDLISVNRTYFGVGVDRSPQMQMNKDGAMVQIANNVISGHGRAMLLRCQTSGSTANFNAENNFFQRGPNSSGTRNEIEIGEIDGGLVSVYSSGNKYLNNGETLALNMADIKDARYTAYPDSSQTIRSGAFTTTRHNMPAVALVSMLNIDGEVVDRAGATPDRRDATTARIMSGYATSAGYVTSEDRRVMADGPTRLDVSRADKTSAAFRSQYSIADTTNCLITDDGNGQGWTLFDQFMYWLESQA